MTSDNPYRDRDRKQRPFLPIDLPVGAVVEIYRPSTGNRARVVGTSQLDDREVRVDVDGGDYILFRADRTVYAFPSREHDPNCFSGPHEADCPCWCHDEVEAVDHV